MRPTRFDDFVLRNRLLSWLDERYSSEPGTSIREELIIPRPSVRADVVVTNGRFAGYEIKSDLDGWSRLPRQVRGYGEVFERAYLVTTSRRVDHIKSVLPNWWGLIEIKPDLTVRIHSRGRRNPALNLENVLHILPRNDLTQIATTLNLDIRKSLRKPELVRAICTSATKTRILSEFRAAMKR